VPSRGHGCGKVILLGEHAVVYGHPALAVGIDRGAHAVANRLPPMSPSTLRVEPWDIEVRLDGDEMLSRAFAAVARATFGAQEVPPLAVSATTELPPGAGLGCSAALGVAVARALDPDADLARIQERVMAWEQIFHGNPSGIDAAVATYGGSVRFERGKPMQPVSLPRALHLCIGHSGIASSTKAMVESVARQRARQEARVDATFRGISALVQNAVAALHMGDIEGLGKLLDMNQMMLSGLLLSTPEIEDLCVTARAHGALGAKVTGAGGGGCVVALVRDEFGADEVLSAWRAKGYQAFSSRVGGQPESRRAAEARV
jgi:mevalonate kinase